MSCPCVCLQVCDVPECCDGFSVDFNNPVPPATELTASIEDAYGNIREIGCEIAGASNEKVQFDFSTLPDGFFNANKGIYKLQVRNPTLGGCNFLCFVQGTDPVATYNCIAVKASRNRDAGGVWPANFITGECTCLTWPTP